MSYVKNYFEKIDIHSQRFSIFAHIRLIHFFSIFSFCFFWFIVFLFLSHKFLIRIIQLGNYGCRGRRQHSLIFMRMASVRREYEVMETVDLHLQLI